ncbi:DUF2783 domain-containing protein [Archangium sp.]|uniref:DUF2783 domain-containing protein n=1 Tax=Archangium sp. TaxID=1872627 RepID=UPI002D533C97|nr:DUF2783 domain-containing protein [Archangium sp.]HYO51306.1 DUF2783 domain-containing protein [Archangium sp.]
MAKLRVELGLDRPDDVYDMLMKTFDGLTEDQSELLMAKLILVLTNHIGDPQVLAEALTIAREGVDGGTWAKRSFRTVAPTPVRKEVA